MTVINVSCPFPLFLQQKTTKYKGGWRFRTISSEIVRLFCVATLFTSLQPHGWRFIVNVDALEPGSDTPSGKHLPTRNILSKNHMKKQEKNTGICRCFLLIFSFSKFIHRHDPFVIWYGARLFFQW